MEKLIYIHVGLSSFVKKDIAILEKSFDLSIYHFKLSSKAKLPFEFIKQGFYLIKNLRDSKGAVVQFAGYQSFIPTLLGRLFKRNVIIVLGGTDCVSFPSIQYGALYKKYLRVCTRVSLCKASLLLPVSETLIEYDYKYTSEDFTKQGYLAHVPNVTTEVKTIYNGYNSDKWLFSHEKEPNSFLTIGADLGTRFGKLLKGIDLIIAIAPRFPDCTFYIIGGDRLNEQLPLNVITICNMPHQELPAFIQTKQFYMQLSMSEGFPNALCEAMLCGCVPIVSATGAMPFIVQNENAQLKRKDIDELERLVQYSIDNYSIEQAKSSRERIKNEFPLTRRSQELTDAIQEHLR